MTLVPSSSRGGSGGGSVNSVTATDGSVVVAGTAADPTIATGTLDVIATLHPPAAAVPMNAKKITGLANGSAATDAAAYGQVSGKVDSVAATDASIVVAGTATAPTIATATLDVIATLHPPAAAVPMNAKKITGLANGSAATDAAAYGQLTALVTGVSSVFGRTGAVVLLATDVEALFTATGQIFQGTGAGTGTIALPPGYEVAYDQITAGVNVTGTNEAGKTSIIAGTSKTYENVPYIFEFFSPQVTTPSLTGGYVVVLLIQDGTTIAQIAYLQNDVTGGQTALSLIGKFRFTPTAGAHTYGIASFCSATTGTPNINAGVGNGLAVFPPAYLRVTKV
jgi:hypothetical protein